MNHVQCERDAAVLCIALNRPEKKNALTAEMYSALADAVEQGEADAGSARAVAARDWRRVYRR